jgi:YfiR/HmsC-like
LELRHVLIFAIALAAAPCRAADDRPDALSQRVKAAFLSKFPSYVEWPSEGPPAGSASFVIGVAGGEAIVREIEQAVAGQQLHGRPLQVRRLGVDEPIDDCCQVLFIDEDIAPVRADALLAEARGRAVLTVTDAQTAPAGSIINFVHLNERIRFDISRQAARRNGLQLRSQLLNVARQVDRP